MQHTERISHPSSPPMGSAQDSPNAAQVLLGRYRVLEVNNEGGFGTVNVCWDARLQRRVAIKRMPLQLGPHSPHEASTTTEALAEARTSSMLQHPNIVTMFDFECDDTYSYLVMEYVDGMNLADFLARVEGGVLTFDECAHLVDSVASALDYAHENGVLHLDIKPANIMVDRSGTVKLADFGMASLASAAGYGGARGGTVGYMPPEQIEGDLVDERCDVFSLAVVVWQALTGSCPFSASTPEQSLKLIERGPSPALSKVEPELAGTVEDTLLAALEPNPSQRTASIGAFAHQLIRALGDPREGAASLHDLLNQTEPDKEPDTVEDWERLQVPLTARAPWLASGIERLFAAGVATYFTWNMIPYIAVGSQSVATVVMVLVFSLCMIWPPISGAFGILSIIAAFVSQRTAAAFALASILGIAGLIWWILAGRRSGLTGPALLAPCVVPSPIAGVGLAAFGLGPVSAFFTGLGGYALYIVQSVGCACGFEAKAFVLGLQDALTSPQTLLFAAMCGVASLIGATLSYNQSPVRKISGQIVAFLTLATTYILEMHMENGHIASALDRTSLIIALTLGATLCIISALMGDGIQNREDDERL